MQNSVFVLSAGEQTFCAFAVEALEITMKEISNKHTLRIPDLLLLQVSMARN
jgi:hypothetical protein